jgi:nitroreductase
MYDEHEMDRAGAMSLFDAIGTRRSIRYFQPFRPVERWKVEVMFEAAQRSSRSVNASYLKVIACERDTIDPDAREALKTPTNTADLDMAPLYLFTYSDPQAPAGGPERLKDLYDRGAFAPALGWSHRFADEVVGKTILEPLLKDPAAAGWMAAVEAAQSLAHILLSITALGLGACCKSWNSDVVKDALSVPDDWQPMWMVLVGYPAEDMQAGGQRPRAPISQDYFWNDAKTPFETTPEVTEALHQHRLLQPLAPYPWRQAEIRAIARAYGLPEE